MRRFPKLLGTVVFTLGLASQMAHASPFAFGYSGFTSTNNITSDTGTVYNIDSGWFNSQGGHDPENTNYFSGYQDCGPYCSNYFSFNLADLAGSITSASFTLYSYVITDPGTFHIYGTGLLPSDVDSNHAYSSVALYTALTSGPLI